MIDGIPGKVWNGISTWWKGAPKNTPQNIHKHDFTYSDRVRKRALEDPRSHNFPYSFDDDILATTPIMKDDGYKIHQLAGEMNGKQGVFEIGVNKDGVIDHRFFRPTTVKLNNK